MEEYELFDPLSGEFRRAVCQSINFTMRHARSICQDRKNRVLQQRGLSFKGMTVFLNYDHKKKRCEFQCFVGNKVMYAGVLTGLVNKSKNYDFH